MLHCKGHNLLILKYVCVSVLALQDALQQSHVVCYSLIGSWAIAILVLAILWGDPVPYFLKAAENSF